MAHERDPMVGSAPWRSTGAACEAVAGGRGVHALQVCGTGEFVHQFALFLATIFLSGSENRIDGAYRSPGRSTCGLLQCGPPI